MREHDTAYVAKSAILLLNMKHTSRGRCVREHDTAYVAKSAILLLDMKLALSTGIPSGKKRRSQRLDASWHPVFHHFHVCRN